MKSRLCTMGPMLGLLLSSVGACSGDEVDARAVEGRYVGTWDWQFGRGPISIEVSPSAAGVYDVDFYETSSFRPGFNADGITPDAVGTVRVMDTEAMLDLDLRTDSPRCVGRYVGTGSRDNRRGVFRFDMSIVHDCAEDASAIFTLTKVANG